MKYCLTPYTFYLASAVECSIMNLGFRGLLVVILFVFIAELSAFADAYSFLTDTNKTVTRHRYNIAAPS